MILSSIREKKYYNKNKSKIRIIIIKIIIIIIIILVIIIIIITIRQDLSQLTLEHYKRTAVYT